MLLVFIAKTLVAINTISMYNCTDIQARGSFLSHSAESSAMFVPLHHESQLYTHSKLVQCNGFQRNSSLEGDEVNKA